MTTTLAPETELRLDEDLERALSQHVGRAAADGHPYAVVAVAPRRLPGEDLGDVVSIAAQCVRGGVRETDLAGLLEGEIVVIGLPETGPGEARSVAHRIQTELGIRSAKIRARRWEWGIASLHRDGEASSDLLRAAIEGAETRPRRLAL